MGAVFHAHQPYKTDSESTLPFFETSNNQSAQAQSMNLKYRPPNAVTQPPITDPKLNKPLAPSNASSESANSISVNVAPTSTAPGQTTPAYWPGATPFGYNTDNLSPYNPIHSFQPPATSPSVVGSQPPHQHQHPQLQESRHLQPQQSQQPQPQQSQSMTHSLMSTPPDPGHVSPATSQQESNLDPYGQRIRYPNMQQPSISHQHPNLQPYQNSPMPMHPSTVGGAPSRIPGAPGQVSVEGQQTLPQYSRPYPSYSLPAMNGPVMSNVHHPGNQMALIGSMQQNLVPGFNSGHSASLHQMYNGHPNLYSHHMHGLVPPGPPNDRPFRCDICPQSFNRNHDLKRHKRIHLAVKPYPCDNCDKSFSRKDALKRHSIVKGCGSGVHIDNDSSGNNKTAFSTPLSAPNLARDGSSSGVARGQPLSGPGSRKGSTVGI